MSGRKLTININTGTGGEMTAGIDEAFLEVIEDHRAGSPPEILS